MHELRLQELPKYRSQGVKHPGSRKGRIQFGQQIAQQVVVAFMVACIDGH
jgi:hypothetical protein